jgi:hypothetical protein
MLPILGLSANPGAVDMAAFLAIWGIFALGLFICTLKMHKILALTLFFVVLLVVLLVTATLTGDATIHTLGGITGIITGALALYIGLGQVINEVYGEKVFPV